MNLLNDIITYVRRIVKTPNNASLSDNLIIDYINRFWLMDVDARMQLFDLRTKYQFQTIPGIADYNMPLYGVNGYPNPQEPGGQVVGQYPVYQGFMLPCYANGIEIPFYNQRDPFWKIWPNYIQSLPNAEEGNGTKTIFTLSIPYFPAIPGHVDITGIIATNTTQDPIIASSINTAIPLTSIFPGVYVLATATDGTQMVIQDSGQFLLNNTPYGLLMTNQGASLGSYSTTSNTVNYATGVVNVAFPKPPMANTPIQTQCYYYQQGLPRAILYWDNCLTLRPPPDIQYLIEIDAYLSPAAFLQSGQAIPFAYMAEYLSRGAARKILSDTGDMEQFQFYEPLFKEQETLVWKRSQRIFTATRIGTIFSDLQGPQSALGTTGQGAT